jgi:hypothetical protein
MTVSEEYETAGVVHNCDCPLCGIGLEHGE